MITEGAESTVKQKSKKWIAVALCLLLLAPSALAASASAKWRLADPAGIQKATESIATVSVQNALAEEVVRQVNAERARAGLSALRVSAELNRAARIRATEIIRKFSHTRPDGTAWSTVSSAAYGENIARGQRTADKVMAAWLTSAGHRANILRASYGSIGVCAVVSGGVTYWAQLFGK